MFVLLLFYVSRKQKSERKKTEKVISFLIIQNTLRFVMINIQSQKNIRQVF